MLQPLSVSVQNGHHLGYTVLTEAISQQGTHRNGDTVSESEVNTTMSYLKLTLLSDTEYSITVHAYNTEGYARASSTSISVGKASNCEYRDWISQCYIMVFTCI